LGTVPGVLIADAVIELTDHAGFTEWPTTRGTEFGHGRLRFDLAQCAADSAGDPWLGHGPWPAVGFLTTLEQWAAVHVPDRADDVVARFRRRIGIRDVADGHRGGA
jgi:hypothetical protein